MSGNGMALEEARRQQEQVLQSRTRFGRPTGSAGKSGSAIRLVVGCGVENRTLDTEVREHDELLQVHEQRLSVQRTKLKQVQGERERYALFTGGLVPN